MEQHRADALCASCHSKMDVLGFGLENYDATGRWRTQDGKFPIDASGAFPNGKSFNSPAEMKTLLKDNMPDSRACLAEKMLTYALGRGVEPYDRIAVQESGARRRRNRIPHAISHSRHCTQRAVPAAARRCRTARNSKDGGRQRLRRLQRNDHYEESPQSTDFERNWRRHQPAISRCDDARAESQQTSRRRSPPSLVLCAERHRHAQLDAADEGPLDGTARAFWRLSIR